MVTPLLQIISITLEITRPFIEVSPKVRLKQSRRLLFLYFDRVKVPRSSLCFTLFSEELPLAFFRPSVARNSPQFTGECFTPFTVWTLRGAFRDHTRGRYRAGRSPAGTDARIQYGPRRATRRTPSRRERLQGGSLCLPPLNPPTKKGPHAPLARQLLKRLERCGWFDYEYRELEEASGSELRSRTVNMNSANCFIIGTRQRG